MASVLKVDKLDPQSGTALEIGTSGDTITVPSGATLDISSATLTPPATLPASSGVNLTALNASNLGSGTVPTARLGTGTASSSTVLYGDQTYKAEPSGETNTPAFSVYLNTTQSIANTTYTKIGFNAENYDTDSAFDSSTNYRFTVPVGGAGKYFFSSKTQTTGWTSTGLRLIAYLNGATKIWSRITATATSSGGYHSIQNTWSETLSEADYIEMFVWHDNGSTQTILGDGTDWGQTIFSGFKVTA